MRTSPSPVTAVSTSPGSASSAFKRPPKTHSPRRRSPEVNGIASGRAMCEGMAMARVKVLFHDNCFDGAASASLFTRFYAARVDAGAEFAYLGKHHGQGEVYEESCF